MNIKRKWNILDETNIIESDADVSDVVCFILKNGRRVFQKPEQAKCESVCYHKDGVYSGIPAYLITNYDEIPTTVKENKNIFSNRFFN